MAGVGEGPLNLQEYRDQGLFHELAQKILPQIEAKAKELGRKLRIMEVCGTHTISFAKTGVKQLLADSVELISGPGCPVCVTDQSDIDQMIAYAQVPGTIVATFGDMMKVPGSVSTLYKERAAGADVRVVYSPTQAVALARENPERRVVFLGVGFETTAPGIALSIQQAERERLSNYFVYAAHKLTPPALQALVEDPTHQIDGFLLPGHVSVIIGRRGWHQLEALNQPAVIGGFEPLDLLISVYQIVQEMAKPVRSVINGYPRIVREEGNQLAQTLLAEVFAVADTTWRGFGLLPASGLQIAPAYQAFDAKAAIAVEPPATRVVKGCRCGEVVKGKESPLECALFGKVCTPENPLGPCMVSTEGACAIYFAWAGESR